MKLLYYFALMFAFRSQMQKERDETKEAVADIAKSLQVKMTKNNNNCKKLAGNRKKITHKQ